MINVAINGFGRIGRTFLRAAIESSASLKVVAINDLGDVKVNAHLLKFDTTHKKLKQEVLVKDNNLIVGDDSIAVFQEKDPEQLPFKELDVDVVIESTGKFTNKKAAEAHLKAGAKRVIISAPAQEVDKTFVIGVNDDSFDPATDFIVSNASCTTNCFVPMVKVLQDAFGIVTGLMTTVHAMTNDQNLLDLVHKDLRRARSAPYNIVPTSTGAARATGQVISSIGQKLDGHALRVPIIDGSITDFCAIVKGILSVDEVNDAFKKASLQEPLSKVLVYSEEPIVSSDIVGNSASCIFDSLLTMTKEVPGDMTLVKVFGWYDNEWGYANRLVDLALLIGSSK
jgi:glyceraldehyde 3-phosphate dehydrogenase